VITWIMFLGKLIGDSRYPTVVQREPAFLNFFDRIIEVYEDRDPVVRHGSYQLRAGDRAFRKKIQDAIWSDKSLTDQFSSRYFAI